MRGIIGGLVISEDAVELERVVVVAHYRGGSKVVDRVLTEARVRKYPGIRW